MKRTLKKIGFIVLAICMLAALFTVSAGAEYYASFNGHLDVHQLCTLKVTVNGKDYSVFATILKDTLTVTANGQTFNYSEVNYNGEIGEAEFQQNSANLPDGLDVTTFYVSGKAEIGWQYVGTVPGLSDYKDADGKVIVDFAGYYTGVNECTNGHGDRTMHELIHKAVGEATGGFCSECARKATGYDLHLRNIGATVGPKPDPEPEEKYTLTYDANGGAGAPAAVTGLAAQKDYVLAESPVPTHADVNGKKVEFIGWTAAKTNKIYANDETAPATIKTVDIEGDTTVYAAWKYAKDGEIKPDPEPEEKYTLTYDANGGAGAPAAVTGLAAQKDYVLAESPVPTHADVNGKKVEFIGWTAAKTNKIYANDETAPATIKTVDIEGDTTVYAAWKYAKDGEIKPDPDPEPEEKYTLTYDANGGEGAPAAVTGLAAQKDYVLAETPVPTHADVNGKKVEFIGWTATKTNKIYANDETAPATIKTVDIEGDTTVYAAWKYAKDGEIVPDPDPETEYTLTFEPNGGTKVDSVKAKSGTVIDLGKYTTEKDGYKFLGWFADAELTQPVDSVTLIKDTTVYAKWEKTGDDGKKDDGKKDDGKKDDGKKDDGKKDDGKKTPSTGDTAALLLGSALAAVTAAGTVIISAKRKKSGEN